MLSAITPITTFLTGWLISIQLSSSTLCLKIKYISPSLPSKEVLRSSFLRRKKRMTSFEGREEKIYFNLRPSSLRRPWTSKKRKTIFLVCIFFFSFLLRSEEEEEIIKNKIFGCTLLLYQRRPPQSNCQLATYPFKYVSSLPSLRFEEAQRRKRREIYKVNTDPTKVRRYSTFRLSTSLITIN